MNNPNTPPPGGRPMCEADLDEMLRVAEIDYRNKVPRTPWEKRVNDYGIFKARETCRLAKLGLQAPTLTDTLVGWAAMLAGFALLSFFVGAVCYGYGFEDARHQAQGFIELLQQACP